MPDAPSPREFPYELALLLVVAPVVLSMPIGRLLIYAGMGMTYALILGWLLAMVGLLALMAVHSRVNSED